jgi:AraC family transcriptional regulator
MNERRVFGDAVAHSLGLHDAPTLTTRTLRASSVAATRISCGPKQIGMTPQIPPEDSFIVAQYLTRLPYHELWSGGRPLLTQGYAANAMRIVNLTGAFSARITHPHETLNFHIPRAALDELADDAGRPRLAHLACTPGIVDPVLVHLAAALLPAFERPEQANSLFVDYVMLAVCSYLVDTYGDGAQPPAVRKGGLTTAQLRRAKEILVANSSGHILLADVARECGLSRQYFTKAFKATTGLAPHRWLQQHRIDHAKQRLSETSLPIADIAILCGFADQSHLTRVFTTLVGLSPAAWRRLRD